jgi:16S rRNA (cytosine967-C5)-methyltransferase
MRQSSARGMALGALQEWQKRKALADAIIAKSFAETTLSAADRAFALELFYGVLRNLTLLDFWISRLRTSPFDIGLRDVVRLGLYQLFFLRTPAHAAVNETVELAPKRGRGLVNGILRHATRRRDELRSEAARQPLSVRESHPQFLITRWERNFDPQATEALCRWNNRPPPLYARINRLRIDPEKFLGLYPNAQPLSGGRDFVEFNAFLAAALERGHCYIQDPSTAIACRLLDPQPGEKVLDACAAPGGKTSYIAELMENRGALAACDRAPQRLSALEQNVARLGATVARPFLVDWRSRLIPKQITALAPFDRLLVDVPCSNTGVMRRRVDVRWRLKPSHFISLQKEQLEILHSLYRLLKPGGVLVYSTCSLEPEENEQVVQQLTREFPALHEIARESSLPFRDRVDGAFAVKLVRAKRA